MPSQPVEILLIEDNEPDVELTRQGLKQGDIATNLHVVNHGGKAISFLRREGEFTAAPRPDLILLDLHMPHMDGLSFLKQVKANADFSEIPIVVLSSLAEPKTLEETYRLKANAYMTKPINFEKFTQLLQTLSDYWFEMVRATKAGEDGESASTRIS